MELLKTFGGRNSPDCAYCLTKNKTIMQHEDYEMFERFNKEIEHDRLRLNFSNFPINGVDDYFSAFFESYRESEKRWRYIANVTYCTKTAKACINKARDVLEEIKRCREKLRIYGI